MLKRFALFLLVWLILTGGSLPGLITGIPAAAASTWLSLALLPPRPERAVRLHLLVAMAPRFLWQSQAGGIDVAQRALRPSMPLDPGWIAYRTRLDAGPARVVLGGEISLLPGTLVAGSHDDILYVHCLDKGQDIEAAMAAEEARIASLAGGSRHG